MHPFSSSEGTAEAGPAIWTPPALDFGAAHNEVDDVEGSNLGLTLDSFAERQSQSLASPLQSKASIEKAEQRLRLQTNHPVSSKRTTKESEGLFSSSRSSRSSHRRSEKPVSSKRTAKESEGSFSSSRSSRSSRRGNGKPNTSKGNRKVKPWLRGEVWRKEAQV
jgi:hypothetical protein